MFRVYVQARVGRYHATALLDSRSTVTVMSEEFVGRTVRPELIQAVEELVYSASGHEMDFTGRAVVKIRVGRRTVSQPVLIARHF